MKKKSSLTILLILIVVLSSTLVACQETTVEQLQNDHGVTVEGGVFDKDAVLVTTKVESTSAEGKQVLETIADVDYDKNANVYIFDLYITNDGVKVQPDGDQSITACKVLHIKENNQVETLIPTIANGKLSFETSSFSYFVVVQEPTNQPCTHDFYDWDVAIEATCQQDGKKYRTCKLCKEQEFETIPALGHDLTQHQGKDATCLEAGYKAYEDCSRCDYFETNTLAKLACGITDTAVTMAAKAHLRCDRPLLIALASNDAMSQNLPNIARLLARKSVFFVPMRQDDPEHKPHSLIADFSRIGECLEAALIGRQRSCNYSHIWKNLHYFLIGHIR